MKTAFHMLTCKAWAVVVAHLAEWLLLTPEVHSSNPVVANSYLPLTVKKDENKEKRDREWPIF